MKALSSAVVIIAFLLLGMFIAGFSFPGFQTADKSIELVPGFERESSVIISNVGTAPFWFSELAVTVNGQDAEILNTRARLAPGERKILFFHSPVFGENLNVVIAGPSNTVSYRVSISSGSVDASCADGVQNQDETDVDCGGIICDKCGNGFACLSNEDCASSSCEGGVCASATGDSETCTDGVQNQDESDVDCGGSCPACANGQACLENSDCVSLNCVAGICEEVALPSCAELGGVVCSGDEVCNGTVEESSEGECCIGSCEVLLPSCAELCGVVCSGDEICNGTVEESSEGECCIGTCESPVQCTDSDGDGFFAEEGCGTEVDCVDSDPNIYPGTLEICDDFIDND
jgi:hypothetical protein